MFRLLSWKILTSSLLQTVKGGKKKRSKSTVESQVVFPLEKNQQPVKSSLQRALPLHICIMNTHIFPCMWCELKHHFNVWIFKTTTLYFLHLQPHVTQQGTRRRKRRRLRGTTHPPPPPPPCHRHRHQPAVSTVPRTWAHIRSVALLLLLLQSHTWGEAALTIAPQPPYSRPWADITGKVDGRNCQNTKKKKT